MSRRRKKRTRAQRRELRESIAWIFGLNLAAGQFLAKVFLAIPIDIPFLILTGVLVVVPLYGRTFFIELIKAVRGSGDTGGPPHDAE